MAGHGVPGCRGLACLHRFRPERPAAGLRAARTRHDRHGRHHRGRPLDGADHRAPRRMAGRDDRAPDPCRGSAGLAGRHGRRTDRGVVRPSARTGTAPGLRVAPPTGSHRRALPGSARWARRRERGAGHCRVRRSGLVHPTVTATGRSRTWRRLCRPSSPSAPTSCMASQRGWSRPWATKSCSWPTPPTTPRGSR